MTRYTNVARKRTYVEAGFNHRESDEVDQAGPSTSSVSNDQVPEAHTEHTEQAVTEPKRKRRRTKKAKSTKEGDTAAGEDTSQSATEHGAPGGLAKAGENPVKAGKGKKKGNERRLKGQEARKAASEKRRLARQDERSANTICYACREQGHAARHCPKNLASSALEGEGGVPKLGRQAVGICYRCGSKKHTLARCPKAVDPENPLPFSSCFVCSKRGHLASSCPQNQSKGVYPNGGCCKLCGETTHLAKNCGLRNSDVAVKTTFVGTGAGAGADEDDFHIFKRKNAEVSRETKTDERIRKQQSIKMGAHSGVVKAFGQHVHAPRKVVTF